MKINDEQAGRVIVIALLLCTWAAFPAAAQSSVDPSTALKTLASWGFLVGGGLIGLISIGQGVKATASHHSVLPAVGGLLSGTLIAFGGPALINHATGASVGF